MEHDLPNSVYDEFSDSDHVDLSDHVNLVAHSEPVVRMDDLDLADVEREICRLPDVSIARIVSESSGRVTEVHVVAQPGKRPKQIVRDVQSIALGQLRPRARPPHRLGRAAWR